jgi:hypothetical protein
MELEGIEPDEREKVPDPDSIQYAKMCIPLREQ